MSIKPNLRMSTLMRGTNASLLTANNSLVNGNNNPSTSRKSNFSKSDKNKANYFEDREVEEEGGETDSFFSSEAMSLHSISPRRRKPGRSKFNKLKMVKEERKKNEFKRRGGIDFGMIFQLNKQTSKKNANFGALELQQFIKENNLSQFSDDSSNSKKRVKLRITDLSFKPRKSMMSTQAMMRRTGGTEASFMLRSGYNLRSSTADKPVSRIIDSSHHGRNKGRHQPPRRRGLSSNQQSLSGMMGRNRLNIRMPSKRRKLNLTNSSFNTAAGRRDRSFGRTTKSPEGFYRQKTKKVFFKTFQTLQTQNSRGSSNSAKRRNNKVRGPRRALNPSQLAQIVKDMRSSFTDSEDDNNLDAGPKDERKGSGMSLEAWKDQAYQDLLHHFEILNKIEAKKYDSKLKLKHRRGYYRMLKFINKFSKHRNFHSLDDLFNYQLNSGDPDLDVLGEVLKSFKQYLSSKHKTTQEIYNKKVKLLHVQRRKPREFFIKSFKERVPFILNINVVKQERSQFSYKIYYSSDNPQPNKKNHELSWDETSKIIKIYDETSNTQKFNKKELFFTVDSNYELTLKLTPKFYEVDTMQLIRFQKKRKMNVFEAFKKRYNLKDSDISRDVHSKKRRKVKLFPKMLENQDLTQNEDELRKRPFLRSLLKISSEVDNHKVRREEIRQKKHDEYLYKTLKFDLLKQMKRHLMILLSQKKQIKELSKLSIVFIALFLCLCHIHAQFLKKRTLYRESNKKVFQFMMIIELWKRMINSKNGPTFNIRTGIDTKFLLRTQARVFYHHVHTKARTVVKRLVHMITRPVILKSRITRTHNLTSEAVQKMVSYLTECRIYRDRLSRMWEHHYMDLHEEIKGDLELQEIKYTSIKPMREFGLKNIFLDRCIFYRKQNYWFDVDLFLGAKTLKLQKKGKKKNKRLKKSKQEQMNQIEDFVRSQYRKKVIELSYEESDTSKKMIEILELRLSSKMTNNDVCDHVNLLSRLGLIEPKLFTKVTEKKYVQLMRRYIEGLLRLQ